MAHKSAINAESQSDLSLLHHNEINAQVTKGINETKDKVIGKWIN
jgi:hypothetical protein